MRSARPAHGVFENGEDIALNAHAAENGRLLRQVTDPQAPALEERQMRDIVAIELDLPGIGAHKPMIMVKTVVLPAPFGPRRPTASPRLTASETSRTTARLPKLLARTLGDKPSGLIQLGTGRCIAHCEVKTR